MAIKSPRSLRAASVDKIRFELSRFERELCRAIGEPERATPGAPGGGDPLFDLGPERALTSYLLAECMSKFSDGKKDPRKTALTWEKFHEAERLCFETNQRLAVNGFSGPFESTILSAQRIAAKIMGTFSWDAAAEGFDFGPGATTRLRRTESDAAFKFSGTPETTIGNAILADAAIRSIPVWEQTLPLCEEGVGYCKIVAGNRIVTVPKNYKVDRTIAIEPDMNMYVQKGIGSLLRRRLKAAGCDLDDQTRNQRLARVGSVSGRLATIDLSMASDTVSRVLVTRFIRPDWLEALEQSRSPFGVLPSGKKIFYQKFSSMGNGYTYELESSIFYSLALAHVAACNEEVDRVSVYGDDIIVPSSCAESFLDLLSFVGFKANSKKSYWTGPFRESCGKHYFLGHEITPFYVRRPVDKLTELFLLHNNLQRWAWRSGVESQEIDSLLKSLRYLAPAKWRKPRLPDGFGDGAFIGEFPLVEPTLQAHPQGWEYYVAEVLLDVSLPMDTEASGMLVKSLRKLNRRGRSILPHMPVDGRPRPVGSGADAFPSRKGRVRAVKVLIPRCAPGE